MRYRTVRPLIVNAIQVNGPADFPTRNGVLHATSGDWVLRDPHGNMKRCNDNDFRSNYAPMKAAQALEHFREWESGGGC